MNKKDSVKKWSLWCAAILLSSIVRAIGIHSFIIPNNFAPGGVTGLAAILEYLTGINAGLWLFVANIPLLIVAFIFVRKSFAFKTTLALLLSSAFLYLLQFMRFPTLVGQNTGDRILFALAGGLLGGFGIAILLKVGGSSGGTDIIATIIQRKLSATNVAWFIFALDSTVVIASFFVYDFSIIPVLLAFVEMFASSKVIEMILQGLKAAIKFEVVTSNPEELSQEIISKINRGVTMCEVKGMYTHENKGLLICIVRKRQVSQFRAILKNYPDSFAYISSTSEVMGMGFNN